MADAHLTALRSSVARLHDLAAGLDEEELTGRAYPSEWTIADVLSHLGSGAVITQRRLDDTIAGQETPEDFAPGVWDDWNAKPPLAQRDDALAADASLLASLDAVTTEQRSAFVSEMGPMTLDFAQFVAMRLNEHALHTWDIEVAGNPTATIPQQAAELIVDNLDLIARFTGKPTGATTTTITVTVRQTARTLKRTLPCCSSRLIRRARERLAARRRSWSRFSSWRWRSRRCVSASGSTDHFAST